MVKVVESKDEFDDLLANAGSKLVIIDFFATWCGPCKIMGPKFDKLSDEHKDVICIKVDVDELEDIVDNYEIKVMPTFIFLKNGQEVDKLEGNVPEKLKDAVLKHK